MKVWRGRDTHTSIATLVFPKRHIIREGRDRYKIYLPKQYNHILETLRSEKVKVDVIIIAGRKQ